MEIHDLVRLTDCMSREIARWKLGEFPDWLATYLNTLPNENASAPYRVYYARRGLHVDPGPLGVSVYGMMLQLREAAAAHARDITEDQAAAAAESARPQRYPCTTCGRGLSESRAIKGYNCPEHVDHLMARGRTAHDTYAKAIGQGPDVDFDRLTDRQRDAWRAAAAAVIEDVFPS